MTAPLAVLESPAYREEEYAFYLDDLKAKALVVLEGDEGPSVVAARANGISILRLKTDAPAPAGHFTLELDGDISPSTDVRELAVDDIALILHTSGTTSRPKIVPLMQSNIVASAEHIKETLQLTPDDRCMNVMPLFHIHGLIAAVTASLAVGASIWCAPGFDALRFFG